MHYPHRKCSPCVSHIPLYHFLRQRICGRLKAWLSPGRRNSLFQRQYQCQDNRVLPPHRHLHLLFFTILGHQYKYESTYASISHEEIERKSKARTMRDIQQSVLHSLQNLNGTDLRKELFWSHLNPILSVSNRRVVCPAAEEHLPYRYVSQSL